MQPQTFGYNDEVDIDLRERENKKWHHGNCVILVGNQDKANVDTFRMVDVADTANRIMNECVLGTKYAYGGTSNVGPKHAFDVAVGGVFRIKSTDRE